MDSFELNKIAGAVLFALLVSFGLSIASEMIFETEAPEAPGYMIAVAESTEGHGEGGEAAAERPHIATLLASADPGAGAAAAKKCGTCHTFGQGEANKVGPNLYGVVMRPIASHPDYEYSPSMVAHAAKAKVWDYDHLDEFLHSPGTTVPKTKMAFPGLKNDGERANVIAYLRTLAASPAPLPEAPAVTAAAEPTTATDAGEAAAGAPAAATAEAAPAETAAAEEAPAEGAAPAPEQPAEAAEVAGVAAQDPATNQAAPEQQAAAPAAQPAATADQPAAAPAEQQAAAPTEQQGGAAGGEQAAVATEGASEGGTNPQVNQPQGTLGPIDSTTADQQGAVPQVAPIEQPAPEPTAGQSEAQQPAEAAQPAAEQQAAPAQPPSEQPAAPAEATAPAVEQQVAQAEAPAPPTAPAAEPGAAEQPAAAAPAAPAEGGAATGFAALVAAADVKKGQTISKRCAACHAFEKGAANKIGPVLWDVVNRPVASVPDFEYSEAMKAFSEGGQKLWTVDELSAFLENPKAHVPGTKMAFPGLKKEDDRANLIGYLHTLSDNPAPLQ